MVMERYLSMMISQKLIQRIFLNHDLLVGGFPCQDYSVARTSASGLEGKKGVLWWEILRIITDKRPKYVMLENVDRLLKSPTSQRGRDFAVMLASLDELDYVVEWRVINAADYGMPQRRRRVFILAYAPGTSQHEALSSKSDILGWIEKEGVHAQAFPIHPLGVLVPMSKPLKSHKDADLADVSNEFNVGANPKSKSPLWKQVSWLMENIILTKVNPNFEGEPFCQTYFLVLEKLQWSIVLSLILFLRKRDGNISKELRKSLVRVLVTLLIFTRKGRWFFPTLR
jgi:DNA (cytosine-5)-methyltransferase 1